ncbi:hypothetical protein [Gordonia terrae]|uniref:hypothetical protein n=1 Tax=Gordonia terrae TaxID=2055 RepID=UPI003F6C4586
MRIGAVIVAIIGLVAGGGIASAAPKEPQLPGPPLDKPGITAPSARSGPPPSQIKNKKVLTASQWGTEPNGQRWFVIDKGTLSAAPANSRQLQAPPAGPGTRQVVTSCRNELTEFELLGITDFVWFYEQTCIGNFVVQDVSTQLWRSSWSGPRGYSGWVTYPDQPTTNSYFSSYFYVRCNHERGFYDYYPVADGWSEGAGRAPRVNPGYQLREDCGPNAG